MIQKSYNGKFGLHTIYLNNFYISNKGILLLTIGWLIFKVLNFFDLIQRPSSLYEPMNYFSKLLMPTIPNPIVFVTVAAAGIGFCSYLLFKPKTLIIRILLTFIVLWINLFQWNWGFESVVSHSFLFCHLCTMLIPFDSPDKSSEKLGVAVTMIKLFYATILATYTLSGFWKWIALGYKIVLKPQDVNWLSDSGAMCNSIVGYYNYDLDFHWILPLFAIPLLWKIAFLVMNSIQILSLFAVNRHQLQPLLGLSLVIFHLVNIIVFNVIFITAIFVIIILFFPYHLISNTETEIVSYHKSELGSKFTIQYPNGEIDTYTGFDAFRAYFYYRHPLIGGLLYLPGLRTLCSVAMCK